MKHPTRHLSRPLRKVNRGSQALSRQASRAVKMVKDDPSFRRILAEVANRLMELAIRIVVISAVNQCLRSSGSPGEHAQVIPFRPKPIS